MTILSRIENLNTSNLGLPRLRLTNLKCPTSNRVNYDLVEHGKIESPAIYNKSLPIVSQFNIALQLAPNKVSYIPEV